MPKPEVKPLTTWSKVWCPNRCATKRAVWWCVSSVMSSSYLVTSQPHQPVCCKK